MIHVMNFDGEIIDFISRNDNALVKAQHVRDIITRVETFDFTILSSRTEKMQERNRIIIQDKNGHYREFIIERISSDIDGYTEIETAASYLNDISKAKPYGPGKLEKMTTAQALSDVLKDTGWKVSDDTEYGGIRTTSWTSYQTRYEVLLQLCTTFNMVLDFHIDIGETTVKNRYVTLKKANPIFNGKEITYGKDLIGLNRNVDFSEIKTALLCIGPEKDDGSRLELVVKDDMAQSLYGLPGRYNWGIYEPESDDQDMTESRLRTLGTTELNKRKSEVISYEVTSIDIEKEFEHEVINLGDLVRIKNTDFTPPLYVEAEVTSEDYDLISRDVTYSFGEYVEYKEADLRNEFIKKLNDIREKLNNNISNSNMIITNRIEEEIERLQKSIHRGSTPPINPEEGDFWYDTTNPKVAVLREFVDGEWRNASAHDVEQIGGMTKESIIFNEINGTFISLSVQHANLTNEVYETLNSEYLVDEDIRILLSDELDGLNNIFESISSSVNSMTSETATIGKLMDTQSLIVQYREKIYTLNNALLNARKAIDERFKLLQSQYTEQKYNEAMQKVADVIGGTYNEETGQLIADIPNKEMLEEMRVTIESAMDEMSQANEAKLQELQNGITQTNQRITNTNEELSAGISSVTRKIEGLKTDGNNLIRSFLSDSPMFDRTRGAIFESETKAILNNGKRLDIMFYDDFENELLPNTDYTLKVEESSNDIEMGVFYNKGGNIVVGYANVREIQFNTKDKKNILIVIRSKASNQFVNKISLYRGLVDLSWTPSSDDVEEQMKEIKTSIKEQSADINILKDGIKLKADSSEVTKIYNEYLAPIQHQVNQNKAALDIWPDQINSKVSREEYVTNFMNVVEMLNTANSERTQLSNQIKDRVTLKDYKATEEKLETMETSIEQNGQEINLKASSEELNKSNKTMSRLLADLTINTTTGLSLVFDGNGTIQSHTVGPNGVKIDTTKFVINDGDVIVQNGRTTIKDAYIDKLFSKQATINYLKAMDVDLNRATVSGSRNGESTVLSGGKIRSTGSFARTFPQGSVTYEAFTESWNGVYRSGLISKQFGNRKLTDIERWLALTDKGITTQREIHSLSPDKNGARFIDFFADESYNSDVYGQGMHIYSGQQLTIESEYGLYLNANKRFYIRTVDSGLEINRDGQNLVLKRTSPYTSEIGSGGSYMAIQSSDGVEQGHVGILSNNRNLSLSSSYGEVLLKGSKVFALDSNGNNRVPMYAQYFSGEKVIGNIEAADTNIYAMCHSELRVVSKAGYNGGDITYKNIRFNSWNAMSHEKYKYDIEEWKYNVLDIYKNELKLHSYKVNSEAGTEYNRIHHGIILRENSKLDTFPVEWRNLDGFDGNEVLWWSTKAIQELAFENEELKKQITDMQVKIDAILEMIK